MKSKPLKTIYLVLVIICTNSLIGQKTFPLYDASIPNAIPTSINEKTYNSNGQFGGYDNVVIPTLEVFLPSKESANGTAVIICPGGGYGRVVYQKEGPDVAKEFIKHGVTAFVLKYRLPSDSVMSDKSIGPLQDAQQAIKIVRERSKEWNIDTNKIGIMGFSAGGHLASSAATHFETPLIPNKANTSLRPDFLILVYPVISMTDQLTHLGSRENLLGKDPTEEKIKYFSNELQITEETPPTYLTHSGDDSVVDVDNSIVFYNALRHNDVPAEMHLYPKGNHGFVFNVPSEVWMSPLFVWMKTNDWIKN